MSLMSDTFGFHVFGTAIGSRLPCIGQVQHSGPPPSVCPFGALRDRTLCGSFLQLVTD